MGTAASGPRLRVALAMADDVAARIFPPSKLDELGRVASVIGPNPITDFSSPEVSTVSSSSLLLPSASSGFALRGCRRKSDAFGCPVGSDNASRRDSAERGA